MLYKKVHRQYVRQYRIGRKFKWKFGWLEEVYEVTQKPYIDISKYAIIVYLKGGFSGVNMRWYLIHFKGKYLGVIGTGREWLED